ncbi:lipopolysaccharide heptosyltransferase II [candidate division KSB1 bacterium]|nr:lipopolysaccharide heptosyltransferase II [candidate division KSB1 bacterium]RQW00203.1 MAG: lipopolysaccharide heptosyltransferase II [candidate division KSB1 bacterium]
MSEIQKILLVQTAFIGDVILTTPLIRSIKSAFPNALLDVLVIPQTSHVLQNNPFIQTLLTFDKRADKKRAFRKTLRRLRRNRYDLALLPHRSLTTAALVFLARIPRRTGFSGRVSSLCYTIRVPFDKTKNQIRRYLDLAGALGSKEDDMQTEIYLTPEQGKKAKEILEPLRNHSTRLAFAPGSVWQTKQWPAENYIKLITLLAEHDVGFVLIGSSEERGLCEHISSSVPGATIINTAGATNLLEAAAVIKACDALVCNDNGAMHLANAVQTDVLAFFGPTVREFGFAPFRSNDIVFETDLDCRPCSAHGGKRCPKRHFRCMLDIEVQSVYGHLVQKFRLS